MSATPSVKATVDVRNIIPRERHPLIFSTFEGLAAGESLLLVNDHDRKPAGTTAPAVSNGCGCAH